MADAYTHSMHAARCRQAADQGVVLVQHVQARMMQTTVCAKIEGAWDTAEGLEMWKLSLLGPVTGVQSLPARRVTQCSGIDGRCHCAPRDAVSAVGDLAVLAPVSGFGDLRC